MITDRITEALRVSSEFANKLDELVVTAGGFFIKDEADGFLVAFWYLNASLHNSILTLFQANLPAGAVALLRPIVESFCRVHLALIGEPDVLQRLRSDDFRLNLVDDARKIDTHFKMGGEFIYIVDRMRKQLHSFTHLGDQQIRRQFNGLNLEANYPEHEIVVIIGMSTSVKFMITTRIIGRYRSQAELQIVQSLLREFSARPL